MLATKVRPLVNGPRFVRTDVGPADRVSVVDAGAMIALGTVRLTCADGSTEECE